MGIHRLKQINVLAGDCVVDSFVIPQEPVFPWFDVSSSHQNSFFSREYVLEVLDIVDSHDSLFLFMSDRNVPVGMRRPLVSPGHYHVGLLAGGRVDVLFTAPESMLFSRESIPLYYCVENRGLCEVANIEWRSLPYASASGYDKYLEADSRYRF